MSSSAFKLVSGAGGCRIECQPLTRVPWLVHGFSTRSSDSLPARKTAPVRKAKRAGNDGWSALRDLGAGNFERASLRQIHSAIIYSVSLDRGSTALRYSLPGYSAVACNGQQSRPSGDALITNDPGILLVVQVADCMPLLLVDREHRAVGAVHAGWRGALGLIGEKTVGEMRRLYGTRPEKLLAVIGPSIRNCCYEVGEEVVDAFSGRFAHADHFFRRRLPDAEAHNRRLPLFFSQAPPGHGREEHPGIYLDLVAVARCQLESAGLAPERIHVGDYCTACGTDLFYSYRKEGSLAGRMAAGIGIRPVATS